MPAKNIFTLDTNDVVGVMNGIRNSAGAEYRSAVPVLAENATLEDLRGIGNIVMNFQPFQNAFINSLVNRIGMVLITSKMYQNPWAVFKKGMLEFGETVEEIFVSLADPNLFDPQVAESEVFKRVIPDVKAAFHSMNAQTFYKTTVSNDQLRQAFLNWNGITDIIGRIIDSLYTSANYDEFLVMKYLIARMALNGNMFPKQIPIVNVDNIKTVVSEIKGVSNTLPFMNSDYNYAGVPTVTEKNDQFIILNAAFDSVIDVEVLASAFNMEKAQFFGQRILVDSFGKTDNMRLAKIFSNDPSFKPLTDAEIILLNNIPAVLLDRNWFMIFDNYMNMTEQYNSQGLYWNYNYHTWKTYSVSPFANGIIFTTVAPKITSVGVTPVVANLVKGSSLQLNSSVISEGFAKKEVVWSLSTVSASTISSTGLLNVPTGETATSITVTATSKVDGTKKGTSIITLT